MSGNNSQAPSRLPSVTGHRASPYGERLPFPPPSISRPASRASSSDDSILPNRLQLRTFYDTTRASLAEGALLSQDALPPLSDWELRSLSTSESVLLPLTCAALHMVAGNLNNHSPQDSTHN